MPRTLSTDGSMMNLAERDRRNYSKRTLSLFFFFFENPIWIWEWRVRGEIGRIAITINAR